MPRKASVFRPILSLCALILLAGSIVLLFLLILAGAFDKYPLNRIFFLQADTNGIPNAPQGIAHWTLYNHCSTNSNGLNINCIPNKAAYPIVPQDNFHTRTNIPNDFFKRRNTFFYLSRFAFAFYLIDIFFASGVYNGSACIPERRPFRTRRSQGNVLHLDHSSAPFPLPPLLHFILRPPPPHPPRPAPLIPLPPWAVIPSPRPPP
ncbi:SUR7-domain-containing protein [Ascodesmis nigricans]|uniref:SUR7-domain-containing protein n=1 Tax=Ascodesmis nigricans TaxID=341454 RepID=A0A4S2MLQ4_9PEZI|nr:SUR7-domain-containing protein [Ascodesmis nigricans]